MKYIIIFLLFVPLSKIIAQTTAATSFDVDGIKVIYKPTLKNIINVDIYFRGGVNNYSSDNSGIELLAVSGAVECGNEKYTNNVFKDKEDSISISLSGTAELDNAHISLNCITKYFDDGWDLLSAAIIKPAYNEDDFEKLKKKLIGNFNISESTPDSRLRTLALQTAFSGTPYAISPGGNASTLTTISREEVKNYYYKTLLNKSRIFIVVVGNISKEDISAKIEKAFADVPALGYKPVLSSTPGFTSNTITVEDRTMATNYIMGIMNAPSYTSADYIPFRLAMSELRGRMFSEIRVQRYLQLLLNLNSHCFLWVY
jgi:zinc protease